MSDWIVETRACANLLGKLARYFECWTIAFCCCCFRFLWQWLFLPPSTHQSRHFRTKSYRAYSVGNWFQITSHRTQEVSQWRWLHTEYDLLPWPQDEHMSVWGKRRDQTKQSRHCVVVLLKEQFTQTWNQVKYLEKKKEQLWKHLL